MLLYGPTKAMAPLRGLARYAVFQDYLVDTLESCYFGDPAARKSLRNQTSISFESGSPELL
jgi:hypothetical protein